MPSWSREHLSGRGRAVAARMPLETGALYACPSCFEENAVGIDPTAGRRQRLVEECLGCCRPLVFHVVVDADGDATIDRVRRE